MRARFKLRWGLLLINILFFSICVVGQNTYKIVDSESSIKVTGTSTLHDWHMVVKNINCTVTASLNEKQNLAVSLVDFKCPSTSIKSDNSLMDSKAYDALNTEKFKEIIFNATTKTELAVNGGSLKGQIVGDLQIAGVKKKVVLPFEGEVDNNEVKLKGEIKVKMTDFNIKPPTAMMGTIKTGDEIVIHYDLLFR